MTNFATTILHNRAKDALAEHRYYKRLARKAEFESRSADAAYFQTEAAWYMAHINSLLDLAVESEG